MRPPGGIINSRMETLLEGMGYKIILWNLSSRDCFLRKDIDTFLNYVKNGITKLSKMNQSLIILQHDTQKFTMESEEEIIKFILNKNFKIVTLDECMRDEFEYNSIVLKNKLSNDSLVNVNFMNVPYIPLNQYKEVLIILMGFLFYVIIFHTNGLSIIKKMFHILQKISLKLFTIFSNILFKLLRKRA